MLDNITIVIRCAYERTESTCISLLQRMVQNDHVHILHEIPFSKAQEKSIEIAIAEAQEWSIFIDADVLVCNQVLDNILTELVSYKHIPFYMMNFAVLDRGFAGLSYGVHCYRTELLHKAQRFFKVAYNDQRPETRLGREMGHLGYPTILSTLVVGIHDYEQYYRDLYRKMYSRGIKFNRLSDYMRAMFEAHYKDDSDYRVMLWGLIDGLLDYSSGKRYAPLEVNYYSERSLQILQMLNLQEKPPLDAAQLTVLPNEVIKNFAPHPLYLSNKHRLLVPDKPTIVTYQDDISAYKKIRKKLKKYILIIFPFLARRGAK